MTLTLTPSRVQHNRSIVDCTLDIPMQRKILWRIIAALFILLATILGIEGMLIIADPMGVAYYTDLDTFYANATPIENGYRMTPGDYMLSSWQYRINDDGSRYVPNNGDSERVYFVGDSITFGWGVNDAETWVNLVAQQLDIDAINAGVPGYNATQVLSVIDALPDDANIVYLSFSNDNHPAISLHSQLEFYSRTHMLIQVLQQQTMTRRDPLFMQSFREIANDDRVTILAFAGDEYGSMAARYGAHLIPPYTQRISAADFHANVDGNREIAAGVLSVLKDHVNDRTMGTRQR